MNHQDHVNLIKKAITKGGGIWADLGSGDGAFTLALADILKETGEIYSIDIDPLRLDKQANAFRKQFPNAHVHFIQSDFTQHLKIPKLNGVIMANSLHFIDDKEYFLRRLKTNLTNDAVVILVEYNVDNGNPWVPYPLSFKTYQELMITCGYTKPQLLMTIPSQFLKEIYSAVSHFI